MVTKVVGNVYQSDVNIIYNAVSNDPRNLIFSEQIQQRYPMAYENYLDEVCNNPIRVGEIQLVGPVNEERQFVFNGYVWDKKRKLNMVAFVKTLVELCNLAIEYHLTVGFQENIIKSDIWTKEIVYQIIEEVFRDMEVDVYIYTTAKRE